MNSQLMKTIIFLLEIKVLFENLNLFMGKRIDWSPYILDRWLTLFFQTYFCYFEPKYKYLTHNNYGFFLVLMATRVGFKSHYNLNSPAK
jgi:hypothetical protein